MTSYQSHRVSNHRQDDCFYTSFSLTAKKELELRNSGPLYGHPPVRKGFSWHGLLMVSAVSGHFDDGRFDPPRGILLNHDQLHRHRFRVARGCHRRRLIIYHVMVWPLRPMGIHDQYIHFCSPSYGSRFLETMKACTYISKKLTEICVFC